MSGFMAMMSSGSIEVICGPMFSGKTEELIRRVRRAQIARQRVQIFKPSVDTRYHEHKVVSHSDQELMSEPMDSAVDILKNLNDHTRVVAVDEVQFFDDSIVTVVTKLADRGYRVICAGLDLDFRSKPFGVMPELLAIADQVTKIQAICTVCGQPASRTQRLSNSEDQLLLGEKDHYEARCRAHYEYDHQLGQGQLPFAEEVNDLSKPCIN